MMRRVQSFVPMGSELEVQRLKRVEAYQIFADMLKKFDKDDLVNLWDWVKESKVFGSILNTEGLIQKLDDLKVNHKFRGGLLGIRGFYNLMLLVQVCAAAED
ncbi:hypothetical protein Tco_1531977 [Tanacetum coccineum]